MRARCGTSLTASSITAVLYPVDTFGEPDSHLTCLTTPLQEHPHDSHATAAATVKNHS